jgi:hypothetical protein
VCACNGARLLYLEPIRSQICFCWRVYSVEMKRETKLLPFVLEVSPFVTDSNLISRYAESFTCLARLYKT